MKDEEEYDFFEEVNTFNISTRYPDEQFKFYKLCTEEFTLAYLFGSCANNTSNPASDIDVALVSDSFTGTRYLDIKKIGRIVRNVDYHIEVHPFSVKDKGESMFLDEIIRTGIRLTRTNSRQKIKKDKCGDS